MFNLACVYFRPLIQFELIFWYRVRDVDLVHNTKTISFLNILAKEVVVLWCVFFDLGMVNLDCQLDEVRIVMETKL